MKIYLLWQWYDGDEPTVVAVTDTKEKAIKFMKQIKEYEDDDDFHYSIDEREINTTTYDIERR